MSAPEKPSGPLVVVLVVVALAMWGGAAWIAYQTGHHGWAFIMLAAGGIAVASAAAEMMGIDL